MTFKVGQRFFDPKTNSYCVLAFRQELEKGKTTGAGNEVWLVYDGGPHGPDFEDFYEPVGSINKEGTLAINSVWSHYQRLLERLMPTERTPDVEVYPKCWVECLVECGDPVKHLGGLEAMCVRHCGSFPKVCPATELVMWQAGDRFQDDVSPKTKGTVVSWDGRFNLSVEYDADTVEVSNMDKWGHWWRRAGPLKIPWHRTRFWAREK